MGQLPALNTLTVVSLKGDRTTGSPLLDSFVLLPKMNSTAYLSQEFVTKTAADRAADKIERNNCRPASNSSIQISLESLSVALSSLPRDRLKHSAHSELGLATSVQSVDSEKTAVQQSAIQILESQDSNHSEIAEKKVVATDYDANLAPASSPVPTLPVSKVAVSAFKQPRKRLPNLSLERAAAVGLLDLSDKLLFGGEDDDLMNACLGGDDSLLTEGDEAVVFKYLSKQIAESTLTQVKSRLPLAVRPQSETEPSEIVLDASNFRVVEAAALAIDSSKAQTEDDGDSERAENGSIQSDGQTLDAVSMSQQIAYLNQKVESLSQELLSLTVAIPQGVRSGSDEAS